MKRSPLDLEALRAIQAAGKQAISAIHTHHETGGKVLIVAIVVPWNDSYRSKATIRLARAAVEVAALNAIYPESP